MDATRITNKYFKIEIGTFGEVLALRYERVDLNKSFDIFREKLINYAIKEIKNAEDVLMLIQDMKDPKSLFNLRNNPKDMTAEESNSELNKEILAARVRHYTKQEARLYSNMNNIYGII